MQFIPIKTRAFLPPRDDLFSLLDDFLPRSKVSRLREGDVLFITSKVLAIYQGRCVRVGSIGKNELIKREAEYWLPPGKVAGHDFFLTIKERTLIPSAGIDESNGQGYYILWPRRTEALLKTLRDYLRKKYKIKRLALVATDSRTQPLRTGVTGISTGFYGLEPLQDYRGKKDIFGRSLKYTQANIVDALSAMAVLMMGEGNERTPLLVLHGAKFIKFADRSTSKKLAFPTKKDLYYPLLKAFYERKTIRKGHEKPRAAVRRPGRYHHRWKNRAK